ncbi:MAG: DNA internalization-related competence protein ComEC/Rec2 [Gammaproteobacteria bacterium]|nr:DNA internalization-related competence protein ComEC/Rec2 [Gammaproteobacteria bacterium]
MVLSVILTAAIIFYVLFVAPVAIFSVWPLVWQLSILLAAGLSGLRGVLIWLPVCWLFMYTNAAVKDRLPAELEGRDVLVSGIVCDVPVRKAGRQRFRLKTEQRNELAALPEQIDISWYQLLPEVRAGEHWQLLVRLKRPRSLSNPGTFDSERRALLQGVGARGYVRQSRLNERVSSDTGACRLSVWRQSLARALQGVMTDSRVTGLMLALSVGLRDQITDQQWTVLRQTGTTHLMAISGLHVGLLAGWGFLAGRLLGGLIVLCGWRCQPLSMARFMALMMALVYSALAGFALPTVRAVLMTVAVLLITGQRRIVPASTILAGALYVLMCLQPLAMLAPGFWLSFGAVALLLLVSSSSSSPSGFNASIKQRLLSRMGQLTRAQVYLSIGLLPFTALFFGQVSLVAPVANILIVPLFSLLLIPLLISGLAALFIWPDGGTLLLTIASTLIDQVMRYLGLLSAWRWSYLRIPSLDSVMLGLSVVMALVLLWPSPLPRRASFAVTLVAAGLMYLSGHAEPALRVVVMDVGQGLAVLVQTPDYNLLYDTGPKGRSFDAGRSIVVPVLQAFGVRKLDRIIISHGDADHAGGAASVLAAYPGAELMASEPGGLQSGPFIPCEADVSWQSGAVQFSILHPAAARRGWSDNDGSCVLRIDSAFGRVLLPGDIEQQVENLLAQSKRLQPVDLVLAPHHGSRTSSTLPFIRAVKPQYVVFSSGYLNRWGFPHTEVRRRWARSGACLLMTGLQGALVFESSGIEGGSEALTLVSRHRANTAGIWTESAQPVADCSPVKPIN